MCDYVSVDTVCLYVGNSCELFVCLVACFTLHSTTVFIKTAIHFRVMPNVAMGSLVF